MPLSRFRVECVDERSGTTTLVSIEAPDADAASTIGNRLGFLVGRVEADPSAEIACPNCGQNLARKLPASHGLCPLCRERFYIRVDQALYPFMVLSRKQVDGIERLRQKAMQLAECGVGPDEVAAAESQARANGSGEAGATTALEELAARFVTRRVPGQFERLGIKGVLLAVDAAATIRHQYRKGTGTDFALQTILADLAAMVESPGVLPSKGDLIWRTFNRQIAATKDHSELASLYWRMAMHLGYEGRDPAPLLRESFRARARELLTSGVEYVQILGGCDAADRKAARKYRIRDFIAEPAIPCTKCTNDPLGMSDYPWCRCSVEPWLQD